MRLTLAKATALVACGAMVAAGCSDDTAPTVPVASVTMSVTVDTIRTGGSTVLVATPLDGSGNPLTGRTATWTSGSPAVATVAADGTVIGVTPGDALITATIEGQTASATVSVFRGLTGSWDGSFDLGGACPLDLSLTEDGAAAITGSGNLNGGACITEAFTIAGANNVGGVADSVSMTWTFPGFSVFFEGNYDGDADISGLLNGGGCVDCVTTATRSSIAPSISSPLRVGGANHRSLKP